MSANETSAPNNCFGCGPENPIGLRLTFAVGVAEDGVLTATAQLHLHHHYEGGTGFVHGGILATLMDEVMSKLNRPLGVKAMTRHLEVDYLRPSPVDAPLTLVGRHIRREGRKLFHQAELRDAAGNLLVTAKGLFITVGEAHA